MANRLSAFPDNDHISMIVDLANRLNDSVQNHVWPLTFELVRDHMPNGFSRGVTCTL